MFLTSSTRKLASAALACVGLTALSAFPVFAQNIFISMNNANNVRVYSPGGTNLGALANTNVSAPQQLAFLPNGDLLVASTGTNRIVRYPGGGGAPVLFASVTGVIGLTTDGVGNVYVTADTGGTTGGSVLRYSSAGTLTGTFATGLNAPRYATIGTNGNLFVAERGTNRVLQFDASTGTALGTYVTTNLNSPFGLVFDNFGNLYVSNFSGNNVRRYGVGDTTGTLCYSNAQGLLNPTGLAINSSGQLMISSFGNSTVYQGALTCTPGSLTVFSNAASGTTNPTGIAIQVQNSTVVPEPGAVALLLGTATTGLLMLSRRRKSA